MNSRTLIPILFFAFAVSSCAKVEIDTRKPPAEVESALRQYFTDKHAVFAELRDKQGRKDLDPMQRIRQVGELQKRCPVSEIVHSFPHGPYRTFYERTEAPDGKVFVVEIDLHAKDDGTCRIVLKNKSLKKKGDLAAAKAKPVTAEEIRKLLE